MEALRTITPEAKAELYARRDFVQDDEEKVRKAVALVEEGRIEPTATPDAFEVIGLSGTIYTTTHKACSCKARRDPQTPYSCYHRLGIAFYGWVKDAMQKQGKAMYVGELPSGTPSETRQDAQEGQESVATMSTDGSETNVAPATQEGPKTAIDDNAQRHTIRRLLTLYGLKPTTKAEYEAVTLTHVGLPLLPENFAAIIERLEELIAARQAALPSPKLLSDYMITIMGKKHVQYSGLLAYAHERGLVSLTASLTTVTKELAIATATATFKDGRSFTDCGDATPENVGPQIKPHFVRMALTRAKARVLRDALNIGEAAAEELAD